MLQNFPKYFSNKAIYCFFALLAIVTIVTMRPMTWYFWLFGIVSIVAFFVFSNRLSKELANLPSRRFIKKIFITSLWIRGIYVILTYILYPYLTKTLFEWGATDSFTYHIFGCRGAEMIANGQWNFWEQFNAMGFFRRGIDISDTGYPIYLSFIYYVSGNSILLARLIKAVLSAVTVVLTFRIAYRNFGDKVARLTAIFCMLMPNLIYYCGAHVKETEMLFLVMLFLDRADIILHQKKLSIINLAICLTAGVATYFFRAIVPIVLALALITALVLGSERMGSAPKRISIVGIILLLVGTVFWNAISEELKLADYNNLQAQQDKNMQWRAERSGGNIYAKYAGSAVFAPLIFTIPFTTLMDVPGQEFQQVLSGGYFTKNILSFFTILALFSLLLSGKWRHVVLPTAFLCGYLIVLVFSNFAQSERFHIPVLPLFLMIAAYGVTVFKKKHLRLFNYWTTFIILATIAWNYIKLKGRGL